MTPDFLTEQIAKLYLSAGLDPSNPLTILPASLLTGMNHPLNNPAQPLLVTGITASGELRSIQTILEQVYPQDHPVQLHSETFDTLRSEPHLRLSDLKTERIIPPGARLHLFVPPLAKQSSFEEFEEIIAHLRAPNGCPWDREQTHLSLRNNLLEETYETLEAIDRGDIAGMQEEFGDLLLQIVLHAQIAAEAGEYRMEDVIAGITRKLVHRHPHVFGETEVSGVQNVLQNWEKLKQKERAAKGVPEKGLLDGVPLALPSLTQAQELQTRAARVGFDWPDVAPVWEKVKEELEEVRQAKTAEEREKELGDLLFAVVNLVRWYKVDSESALRGTNQKFRRRFKHIEKSARAAGRELQSMTLDEMDGYWNEAKGMELPD